VSEFSQVQAAKKSCKDITLDNLVVPGGRTLDLQKLKSGTRVTFSGTTVSMIELLHVTLTSGEIRILGR
jgi:hypothetical protein